MLVSSVSVKLRNTLYNFCSYLPNLNIIDVENGKIAILSFIYCHLTPIHNVSGFVNYVGV